MRLFLFSQTILSPDVDATQGCEQQVILVSNWPGAQAGLSGPLFGPPITDANQTVPPVTAGIFFVRNCRRQFAIEDTYPSKLEICILDISCCISSRSNNRWVYFPIIVYARPWVTVKSMLDVVSIESDFWIEIAIIYLMWNELTHVKKIDILCMWMVMLSVFNSWK